jgi:hypothetical protein
MHLPVILNLSAASWVATTTSRLLNNPEAPVAPQQLGSVSALRNAFLPTLGFAVRKTSRGLGLPDARFQGGPVFTGRAVPSDAARRRDRHAQCHHNPMQSPNRRLGCAGSCLEETPTRPGRPHAKIVPEEAGDRTLPRFGTGSSEAGAPGISRGCSGTTTSWWPRSRLTAPTNPWRLGRYAGAALVYLAMRRPIRGTAASTCFLPVGRSFS